MAEHTYEQLKEMTVVQLREIAQGVQHEALEGFSVMHKEQLLPALCKALNIPTHQVHGGTEKSRVKMQIHKLKAERTAAIAAKDHARLAAITQQIKVLKRIMRRVLRQSA